MKVESPHDLVWWEKYRPVKLEDMAMNPEQRAMAEEFIKKGEIPHLLLAGPAGSGKTTLSKILIRSMDCDAQYLNASKDRGIELIRDRVGTFAKVMSVFKWKVVFFDEGDGLTSDAQNALKSMMEDFSDQTRFIFTANNKDKIIDPIQSRCTVFEFGETPTRERVLILKKILQAEGVEPVEVRVILEYAERYTDLRKMITAAQQSVVTHNGVLAPVSGTVLLGADLLRVSITGEWKSVVEAAASSGFDHRRSMINMFWAIGDVPELKNPVACRVLLQKAVDSSVFSPDQVVHFLGTLSDLMLLQGHQ